MKKVRLFLCKVKSVVYDFWSLIICAMFRMCPIQQKKIVFDNFGGRGYAGYPCIIANEILNQKKDWKLVWLASEKPQNMPAEIKWVRYASLRAAYELITAHVWIDNIRSSYRTKKRKGQYYIQTWHGGLPLKKIEADAESQLSEEYVRKAKLDGRIADLVFSESEYQTKLFEKNFWYKGEYFKAQMYDVLSCEEKKQVIKLVKEFFSLQQDTGIILYAPTFRENSVYGYDSIDFEALVEAVKGKFGGDWVVIIRLHPNVAKMKNSIKYTGEIIDGTDYPQVQALLYASAFLITDYSALMFEAMRFETNVLIFADDYDEYVGNERGFYFDIKGLPFPFSYDNESLKNNIFNYDENVYKVECKEFLKKIGYYSNRKNVDCIVDKIEQVIEGI